MKKISVVIPAYNAEKTIVECVRSVLKNTYEDLEILVIDDGSGDKTAALVRERFGDVPNLRLITKENGGVSSARNRGIAEAAGEVILFLDGDDRYHPDMCRKMAETMEREDSDAVLCGYREIVGGKAAVHMCPAAGRLDSPGRIWDEFIVPVYFSGVNGYLGSVCLAAFKKSILTANGIWFDEKIHHAEDKLFLIRYLLCCRSVSVVPEALYDYDLGDTSVTKRYSGDLRENNRRLGEAWAQVFAESGHEYTEEMKGREAVADVFSILANEARRGNPNPFLTQLRTAASANRDYKAVIRKLTPDSRMLRIKRRIALHSGLCAAYYLVRRVQRAMGVYF